MKTENMEHDRYDELFDGFYRILRDQVESDSSFTLEKLKAVLESQYEFEGQDWGGRGEPKNTVIAARIAAFEHLIAELEQAQPTDGRS